MSKKVRMAGCNFFCDFDKSYSKCENFQIQPKVENSQIFQISKCLSVIKGGWGGGVCGIILFNGHDIEPVTLTRSS